MNFVLYVESTRTGSLYHAIKSGPDLTTVILRFEADNSAYGVQAGERLVDAVAAGVIVKSTLPNGSPTWALVDGYGVERRIRELTKPGARPFIGYFRTGDGQNIVHVIAYAPDQETAEKALIADRHVYTYLCCEPIDDAVAAGAVRIDPISRFGYAAVTNTSVADRYKELCGMLGRRPTKPRLQLAQDFVAGTDPEDLAHRAWSATKSICGG